MKRLLLLIVLIVTVITTSCSQLKEDVFQEPEAESAARVENSDETDLQEEEPPVADASEFYEMMQSDNRPVAVMIDNDVKESRPQMGLESAYMVYEIIVEGGKSRMMALFKNHDLEKVGPIRSSRHYFLDYALEHDAIYCHAGWSPKAQSDISTLGVNNINGLLGGDESVFWRDSTYDNTWHNMYSGVDQLYEKATEQKGYRGTTEVEHTAYYEEDTELEDGENVSEIDLPYSNWYRVSYEYDSEEKVYKRYVDGEEHMSQTGNILTAKNIIIYKVQNFNLKDNDNVGRQDLKNIGSGTGYYITNGKMIEIEWTKSSRTGKTVYTTEDGEELVLNPGNTFVQIVPATSNITLS
ncbi:MAG: DUF3048 domain-containing protein [Clostridia bacterium]|nr:DUF3048 domain-containing protein [Clostridia bacterium]